uniref:Uncharacterized protein n=1 Tax=Clastoptera arizonana TaxID=38151 RepID=A0A1B6C6U1_9HEMI
MAETNDDLLDGDLEGDFGDLDAEEEDALLADDDYIYQQPEGGHLQGSIFIDNEDGGKTNSIHNKYYQGTSIDDVQDVAEGDEILEEEEDVLDLGVVDELESELDEGPIQGGPKTWRIQESTEQSVISEGGSKSNKLRNVNVSSSTRGMIDSGTVESDDEKDEEQRSRFKTERTSGSNIISLKSPLKKSLADIPDSLDSVVPAQMPCIRGKRRGSNRGNRGGAANQQPLVVISTNIENMTEQTNHNFGNFRGNILRPPPRGRGVIQFQRPMRPPIPSFPPRRPPMMGPFPVNQGPRLMQQNINLNNAPKIHINPHFRGGIHSVQAPSIRHEWGGDIQHQNGPPFQNQPQQIHRDGSWGHQGMISEPMMVQPEPNFYQPPQYHQQPMQYMHHNPEPQVGLIPWCLHDLILVMHGCCYLKSHGLDFSKYFDFFINPVDIIIFN